MYMNKFMALQKPAIKSSENKKLYEEKLMKAYDEQREAMDKRIAKNLVEQKKVTAEIISKIKAEIAAEKSKAESKDVLYCPAESKFIVAIQIKSLNGIPPKQKKTMELLRLKGNNQCVILKNNVSIKKMLQIAKDYIAYGTISYELLRKLVYKRGYGKIDHSKVKLTNETIEDAFEGKYKCIESLLEVIYHGGEDMKKVLNFIQPIKLNSPKGAFCATRKAKTFIQGGVANDHKELLGDLLERMI